MQSSNSPAGHPSPADEDGRPTLTKREAEVLSLVILGKSSREVAEALYVSKRTVDFHLANVYQKLKVNNRIQAFHEATRLGLISVEPFALAGEL
jgi:DNA-binding CsgD family transcriptional regulator